MLHAKSKRLTDVLHHLVKVEHLLLECRILTVEHRHLQHFLYEEPQTLRLVIDDAPKMLSHSLALLHRLIIEHLSSQRNAGDRRFQLMRHIIDEVILDFSEFLLSEDEHQSDDKRNEQNQRKHHGRDDKAHGGENIATHIWEMNAHNPAFVLRIVTEKHL